MAEAVGQMTNEQLQKLIEAVLAAKVTGTEQLITNTKSSIASCSARFYGQRDHQAVDEFITAVQTYKELEKISDEEALKGLSLLFNGMASTWWQGVSKEAKTWSDAIALIREHFAPTKPSYQIYMEIFEKKQGERVPIDTFICEKRALLAQLPDGRHDTETELDLIYGLLHIKYRKYIARQEISSFKDLLQKGRIIEHNSTEDEQAKEGISIARSARPAKRCTFCSFRGHTYEDCRKRKATVSAGDDNADEQ